MPLYEYTCGDCTQPFELLVSSPALADSVFCRYCGSASVRRLISSFASRSTRPAGESMAAAMPRGGGCACGGGGCGCGGQ